MAVESVVTMLVVMTEGARVAAIVILAEVDVLLAIVATAGEEESNCDGNDEDDVVDDADDDEEVEDDGIVVEISLIDEVADELPQLPLLFRWVNGIILQLLLRSNSSSDNILNLRLMARALFRLKKGFETVVLFDAELEEEMIDEAMVLSSENAFNNHNSLREKSTQFSQRFRKYGCRASAISGWFIYKVTSCGK